MLRCIASDDKGFFVVACMQKLVTSDQWPVRIIVDANHTPEHNSNHQASTCIASTTTTTVLPPLQTTAVPLSFESFT